MRHGGPPGGRGRRLLAFLLLLAAAAALVAGSGAAAPTNDNFASAQAISGSSGSVTGSNVGATQETGEPLQGRSGGPTLLFSWTAPPARAPPFDTMGRA